MIKYSFDKIRFTPNCFDYDRKRIEGLIPEILEARRHQLFTRDMSKIESIFDKNDYLSIYFGCWPDGIERISVLYRHAEALCIIE